MKTTTAMRQLFVRDNFEFVQIIVCNNQLRLVVGGNRLVLWRKQVHSPLTNAKNDNNTNLLLLCSEFVNSKTLPSVSFATSQSTTMTTSTATKASTTDYSTNKTIEQIRLHIASCFNQPWGRQYLLRHCEFYPKTWMKLASSFSL